MSGKSTQKKNTTKANRNKAKGRKILHLVFIASLCVLFVYNYRALFDRKLDPNGDNISYFLLAKALSEGKGYVDLVPPTPVPHMHFPPGYPMFMSVFMHIFPDNIIAMKVINGLLFLLAVLLMFRIVRKISGGNLWLAFAVCFVTLMHPSLLRWSVVMMSEMLYLVISFGIILVSLDLNVGIIFTKGKKDRREVARFCLLCLLVISAYLVRTMGISVVLAAALAFGVTSLKALLKKDKSWVKPAAVATAVIVSLLIAHGGWSVRNQIVNPGYKNDYSSGFMYTDKHEKMTPPLWGSRLKTNVSEYVSIWIPKGLLTPKEVIDHMQHPNPTAKDWLVGILLLSTMLYGLWMLKKGRVMLISYLLVTFAVLMLYQEQYAGIRYFIPVLPLMFLGVLNGIYSLVSLLVKAFSKKEIIILPVAFVLLVSVLIVPTYVKGQEVYKNTASFDNYIDMNPKAPFANYVRAAEWLKEYAKDNVVVACRKPEIMYMYSGYKHSVRFPLRGEEKDILDFLKKTKTNIVVFDTWSKHAYTVILPVAKKHENAFPVLYATPNDINNAPTVVSGYRQSNL